MGSGAFLVETCRQLADALIEAWGAHGEMPAIPPDEDEVIHARRLVAQRCLYGIDRNPMAVDLAKVSLWLSTLARDHPLTFVDHAFRHGDSLVGLTRRQIEALHWVADTRSPQKDFKIMRVSERVAEVAELRRRIREAGEEVSDRERHDLWRGVHDEIDPVRLSGDLVLAAFFAESKPKQREERRRELAEAVLNGGAIRYLSWLEEQRHGDPPLAPFHWEIEFPEVFERENPGFDAFVGNPPFAGKNALAAGNVPGYPDWLKAVHEGSHGNADLVAHFFRRAFKLVRGDGAFGLIATNTIAQGDTRSSGLRWICEHGGKIYRATRRVKWPGDAAVVVSVLHVAKGGYAGRKALDGPHPPAHRTQPEDGYAGAGGKALDDANDGANIDARHPAHRARPEGMYAAGKVLDGVNVEDITAFLFHRGGHADPARLEANAGKSFVGSYVLGMGFTFDDTDRKGAASPPRRDAAACRGGPAQPGGDLPLHRRRGGEYEPHPRTPPLRHQLPRLAAPPGRLGECPGVPGCGGFRPAGGRADPACARSAGRRTPAGRFLRRRIDAPDRLAGWRVGRKTHNERILARDRLMGRSDGGRTPRVAANRNRAARLPRAGGGRLAGPAGDRRGAGETGAHEAR